MKLHYILFLSSIIILIITVYLWSNPIYNKTRTTTSTTHKEGFESLTNCLSQGYPPDFCRRVPLQACLYNCPEGTFKTKKFNTFSSQFPG
jgi:hypothetical protein